MPLSDSDRLKRAASVREVGIVTCNLFSKHIGVANSIEFVDSDSQINEYVGEYERVLDEFRNYHAFKPESLANQSKRAAAWVVAGRDYQTVDSLGNPCTANRIDGFFKFLPPVADSVYRDLAPSYFLLQLCYAYLHVQTLNVDHVLEHELLHNLTNFRHNATMEWMVTQMHALALASGGAPFKHKSSCPTSTVSTP